MSNPQTTRAEAPALSDNALDDICRGALVAEATAITDFAASGQSLARAARMIVDAPGPLIVAGIGKSGHIASKIASTFRSIGKTSIFLHAAEASHGDLGLVQPHSVVLVLSNSGETTELSDLLHYCRVHGIAVIGLTASEDTTLARAADLTIAYGRVTEVCPNRLAPTTSTTLSLAIGDALAVGVTHLLGTAAEDFRRYHPGGKLGALLLSVGDLMHRGEALPIVAPDATMSDTVVEMSQKALGVAIVVKDGAVRGIITDGDMRRHAETLWQARAGDIATANPISVTPQTRAKDALDLMTEKKITACLVCEADGALAGLLHVHDCLRAGLS